MQVGNIVTVGGYLLLDPVAASTLTEVGISLPVASNFTDISNLAGTTACGGSNTRSGQILADVTNKRAQMILTPTDVVIRVQAFTFVYQVL